MNEWRKHCFNSTCSNELIKFDGLQKEIKKEINLVFLFWDITGIFLSQLAFLICVCGAWWTIESWQPVGWDPTITSQINAAQTALMGRDRKFCYPLGCNYPAGCCIEWPLFLYYLLNPELMSGLISKSPSAMPIPQPSTVDSVPP